MPNANCEAFIAPGTQQIVPTTDRGGSARGTHYGKGDPLASIGTHVAWDSGLNQTDGSQLLFFRRPRGSGRPGPQTRCRPALGDRFRAHVDDCVRVSSVRI